ncbi:MAG: hypothetical protein P4L50_17890 [Anaerolineaceae bacterium]|nr:hypothetical protein [Anaerolineaceae bacterium]
MVNSSGRRILLILSAGLAFSLVILALGLPAAAPPQAPKVTPSFLTIENSWVSIPITGNQVGVPISSTLPPNTHSMLPGTPPGYGATLTDTDSSLTAASHHPPGGDDFDDNLFERPFNANTQDTYFPQVDILQSSMVSGSPWVYGSITLKGGDPSNNQLDASYALELDLHLDGRGNLLVVANHPAQGDWSTKGVQVFLDPNQDVGGDRPLHPDATAIPGDGYEQKVFDSGVSKDADLAWARVAANQPNVVWFAFKTYLVKNATKWMWSAWAQNGGLHPELFDYNDEMSPASAGNPLPGNPNYPLKSLAEMDNTCRGAVGFTPTGSEPGLCSITATPTPGSSSAHAIIHKPFSRLRGSTSFSFLTLITVTPTPLQDRIVQTVIFS